MPRVNTKTIEKIFNKIDEKFFLLEQEQKITELYKLERKANCYDNESYSNYSSMKCAYEKIEYYIARVYCEGKSKRTLNAVKRNMENLEHKIECLQRYGDDQRLAAMIKDTITFFEISLNLDISFYTSLYNLYQDSLEGKNLRLSDIERKYDRGGWRR